jgi:hypothetical protein
MVDEIQRWRDFDAVQCAKCRSRYSIDLEYGCPNCHFDEYFKEKNKEQSMGI